MRLSFALFVVGLLCSSACCKNGEGDAVSNAMKFCFNAATTVEFLSEQWLSLL